MLWDGPFDCCGGGGGEGGRRDVQLLHVCIYSFPNIPFLISFSISVDFFQLLFACCQENVFASERYRRMADDVTAISTHSSRRSSRSRNTTPDFMWNITWLDFVKVSTNEQHSRSLL